jgi:hypothetical protein
MNHIPQRINSSKPLKLKPLKLNFTNTLPALVRIQYFNHKRRQPRIMPNPSPWAAVILRARSFHFLHEIENLYMYADLDRLWFVYYKNTHIRTLYLDSTNLLSYTTQSSNNHTAVSPTFILEMWSSRTNWSKGTKQGVERFDLGLESRVHRSHNTLSHRSLTYRDYQWAFSFIHGAVTVTFFKSIKSKSSLFGYRSHSPPWASVMNVEKQRSY